jgi:hypothetical protein
MASYFPPTEDLPIFDNEVFDASNSDAQTLTIAKANLLYLRKTIADTATALETFNAGILSSSLDSLTPSTDLNIGTTMISGHMNIGTNAGRSGVIHIGDGNNCTTTGDVHINNGNVNASDTLINSGNGASSGTVGIATGTGGSNTTKVNISTGSTTGLVNIGNNNTSVTMNSNNLILGSSTKAVTMNCPITVGYLTTAITSNTQIGFQVIGTSSSVTSMLASTITTFWSAPLVSGVWYLLGNAKYATPGAFGQLYITSTIDTSDDAAAVSVAGVANAVLQVSRMITVAAGATPTYYLTGGSGSATTVSNIVFRVYRIA